MGNIVVFIDDSLHSFYRWRLANFDSIFFFELYLYFRFATRLVCVFLISDINPYAARDDRVKRTGGGDAVEYVERGVTASGEIPQNERRRRRRGCRRTNQFFE